MSDPAIKLFGKMIQLPDITAVAAADTGGVKTSAQSPTPHLPPSSSDDGGRSEDRPSSPDLSSEEDNNSSSPGEQQELDKDSSGRKLTESKEEDGAQLLMSEEVTDPNDTSVRNDNPKTPSFDNEAATVKTSKTEEEQSETSNSEEKTLKKPDKILPCPRCNSMETKFCYYNNYNVNQPRHFCKNCQRYWTAGGTMRNVPVGAGRRKNKNSASHFRHITVSEALQNARADLPNGVHHPTLKANGTVLTFGSDAPLCESMASVLNIAEKTMQNCSRNGFQKPEELRRPVSYRSGDNADDHSSGSSVTAANSKDEVFKTGLPDNNPVMQNCPSFPPQMQYFPGAPWPYPWNPSQWNSSMPPPFYPGSFPMSLYPAPPYWGCAVPGGWNVHWVTPPTSTPNFPSPTSGPNSPTLGKHSRDENVHKPTDSAEDEDSRKENNPEKCLWFPKTLRIDDPGEAARSSIWVTLGIKNDKADSITGGGLFKSFQSKDDEKHHISGTSQVLQANPAALSRSRNFHESS